jgi:hypothetical protein
LMITTSLTSPSGSTRTDDRGSVGKAAPIRSSRCAGAFMGSRIMPPREFARKIRMLAVRFR